MYSYNSPALRPSFFRLYTRIRASHSRILLIKKKQNLNFGVNLNVVCPHAGADEEMTIVAR